MGNYINVINLPYDLSPINTYSYYYYILSGKPGILEMLTSVSRKMTVNTYEDVTIFCHVIGYPKPLVTWLKADGSKLIEKRTEIRNDSLVIKQTEEGDSAEYICKAQNIHGTVEMRFPLTVKPRDGM